MKILIKEFHAQLSYQVATAVYTTTHAMRGRRAVSKLNDKYTWQYTFCLRASNGKDS